MCGAQNLAVGQLVPVARVGAVLPGERRIEKAKIRGVVSDGMLCSPTELGLGEDADGILILGTGDEQVVGSILVAPVGETVLDVDVKPNRGDALSMIGLAREIAAATGTIGPMAGRHGRRIRRGLRGGGHRSRSATPSCARGSPRATSTASVRRRRRPGWPTA